MPETAAEVAKKAINRPKPKLNFTSSDFLSTGSTLLDLGLSGKILGGIIKGYYYLIVGDSEAGKTWIAHTTLAEASVNKNFDEYRLIYDETTEHGALMDIQHYFGKKLVNRIEPPAKNSDGTPNHSRTVEELYYHLDDAFKIGKPFIYIVDSQDGLSSKDEQEKFDEEKEAFRSDKQTTGTYGDGKAKKHKRGLRLVTGKLKETGSILIILGQSIDNLGFGFDKKTRAGGKALKYWATAELWTSVREQIKKTIRGKPMQIGTLCKIDIKKDRSTGKRRTVEIPILHGHGIDDVGNCCDYLIDWKHWEKTKGGIDATEFDFKGSLEKLIEKIESTGGEKELKLLVNKVWNEIEDECVVSRKKKYE